MQQVTFLVRVMAQALVDTEDNGRINITKETAVARIAKEFFSLDDVARRTVGSIVENPLQIGAIGNAAASH